MAVSGKKAAGRFSSSICRGSGEDFDLICQPCDRDDLRLPAFGFCQDCQEHLCESCFNHHKRPKPLRHHILLDKQNMPQTQQLSTSVHSGQSDDLTKPCPKHMKEMIKFYCHGHQALLCSVCVTLEHTTTGCRINYIPDISQQSLNSKEYTDIHRSMDVLTEKCKKLPQDLKQMTAKSNTSLIDVIAEINKFRHEMNQRLDVLQKAAEGAAKTVQKENDTKLQTAETTCNDAIKSLKASSEAIKQHNTSKRADRLFMEMKLAEKMVQDNEKKLSMLQLPDDIKEYDFQQNSTISTCLKNMTSIGTLVQKTTKPLGPPPASTLSSVQFSRQGEYNVKTSHDSQGCLITGMVFLQPSKFILADRNNKSIKMFDINSFSITDQLKPDTDPWEITTVTRDQLVVSHPYGNTIQFISASSNKLSLKHKLKVNGHCRGITCYQEKLALTFAAYSKLEIIDLTGRVLTSVTTDSRGEDIFHAPHHVTSNSSTIYVADAGKHKVFMLNWRGELTGSYEGIGVPRGITVLEDGSFFVIDYSKSNMQHVSGDFTKGKVVVKDLKGPEAVYWCGTSGLLYISSCDDYDKDDNFIQIFQMMYHKRDSLWALLRDILA